MKALCAIRGCDRKVTALGLCQLHYDRVRSGTHVHVGPGARVRLGRIRSRKHLRECCIETETGCWVPKHRPIGSGYWAVSRVGVFGQEQAHRLAWILANGPIPDGLVIAHACDNKPCCNPAHLFLTTSKGNIFDHHGKRRTVNPHQHAVLDAERAAARDRETAAAHRRFVTLILVAAHVRRTPELNDLLRAMAKDHAAWNACIVKLPGMRREAHRPWFVPINRKSLTAA